jgi:uncharacterized protein (TIGR02246 family)
MNKIKKISFFFAILFFAAISSCVIAQTIDVGVQALTRNFQDAYNKEDANALKEMYTADAVRVEMDGKTTTGAENIKAIYEEQFKNANATVLINDVNAVQNNANVIATGTWHVIGRSANGDKMDFGGTYTNTLVKDNGQWKISKMVLGNSVKTMVYHKVADWAKWKEGFDSVKKLRLDAGELSYEIGTMHDDPGTVYVINEWASIENAQAFFSKPELHEAMKNAGVLETPHFMYLDRK